MLQLSGSIDPNVGSISRVTVDKHGCVLVSLNSAVPSTDKSVIGKLEFCALSTDVHRMAIHQMTEAIPPPFQQLPEA